MHINLVQFSSRVILSALAVLLFLSTAQWFSPMTVNAQTLGRTDLSVPVLEYLAEKYFVGLDPFDPAITEAVETFVLPEAILDHICKLEWERGQIENFAADKLFVIVHCPDGSLRAITFRDGQVRKDREIDESRARVLRRLYSDEAFIAAPAPELQAWLDRADVDAQAVFKHAVEIAGTSKLPTLDDDTIGRARENMMADETNTDALTRALGALTESEYAAECCRAAVWLISRMDQMFFRREDSDLSISDLKTVEAQLFFENVLYSVKAKNELPWGSGVSDEDFLQQVLSPRCTGEPLQRWRRHFWSALLPEIEGLLADDIDVAMSVASNAYGDYFQYEGDTTWEDFGMLTSLAVREGRCEDCSNVLNAMYRTIGIPACQTYTPWWGHSSGNHAWTWVRGVGDPPRDGNNAVKLYVKTWDGLEDVTAEYVPVTEIDVEIVIKESSDENARQETDSETEEKAELLVWNHDEWRRVARTPIEEGRALFENVGCGLNFALMVRAPRGADRIADVRTDGSVRWLNLDPVLEYGADSFDVIFDKMSPLGEFLPDAEYTLDVFTLNGWIEHPFEREWTGAISFTGATDRLYRVLGEGISDRPFTVETDAATGEVAVLKR